MKIQTYRPKQRANRRRASGASPTNWYFLSGFLRWPHIWGGSILTRFIVPWRCLSKNHIEPFIRTACSAAARHVEPPSPEGEQKHQRAQQKRLVDEVDREGVTARQRKRWNPAGFCNTFQKTFPGIIGKKTMIDRISWIKEISEKKLYRRKRKYNIFK